MALLHHIAYVDRGMAHMQSTLESVGLQTQKCQMFHSWHLAWPSTILLAAPFAFRGQYGVHLIFKHCADENGRE